MYYTTKKTKELINHQLDCCYKHYMQASTTAEKNFWLYCLNETRRLKNCSFTVFKKILNNINYDFRNCSYYTYRSCKQMLNKFYI